MNVDKWLARALVASFLVNCLLAVWLHQSRRTTQDVEQRTHEYVEARQNFDTLKATRTRDVHHYRTLRDSLVLTDTIEVIRVIEAADSVIASDERALAAADTALARADELIDALRKSNKPKLIQPFVEALWSPYAREYVGRGGIEIRTVKNIKFVVAAEARRDGPQAYVGARLTF